MLSTWLSPADCARLLETVIATPKPGFKVAWGISANTRAWWSQAEAHALGFRPQDDAEQFAEEVADSVGEFDHRYLGGAFCSPELDMETS